jgi:glycosyltransferase involved in cell wall biosynthesis
MWHVFMTRLSAFGYPTPNSGWKSQYGSPLLLSVGQLIPRKGCLELLAIYEQVIKTRPDVSLLIVGDGPYRGEYERMVKERGWTKVHFAGYVQAQELFRYLAIADAIIFHTLYDPYGLVVVEAMAAEVPVLSSVHAVSTHDLVEEGITGFRIDPIDAEASAFAINALLDMPLDQRQLIVKAAFSRVKSCDVDSSAEKFLGCFRKFVTSR